MKFEKILKWTLGISSLIIGIYGVVIFYTYPRWEDIKNNNSVNIPTVKDLPTNSSFVFDRTFIPGARTDIYKGTATLSGEFQYDKGPNIHGGENFVFFPDKSSSLKLPEPVNFDIGGEDSLKKFNLREDTCYAIGTAEITIKDFWLLKAEIGGLSSSELIGVATSTIIESRTFSSTDENCGFHF